VVFRLYANFRILQDLVGEAGEVVANGGFTRSRVWLQIMADVFGKNLLLYENTADSTLGAVLMGLKATGRIAAYGDLEWQPRLRETIHPAAGQVERYQELYRLHQAVYDRNKDLFEALHALGEAAGGQSTDNA